MALTLVTTVNDPTANSYADLAYFRAFVARRGGRALAADDAADTLALVQACDRLDVLPWAGWPSTTAQRLAWGRVGVARIGFAGAGGDPYGRGDVGPGRLVYAPNELPRQLLDGQCELATWIRQKGAGVELWATSNDLVAGATIEVEGAKVALRNDPHDLPPTVWRYVGPLCDFGMSGQGARG